MSFEIKVKLDGNIIEKLTKLQEKGQDLTPLILLYAKSAILLWMWWSKSYFNTSNVSVEV